MEKVIVSKEKCLHCLYGVTGECEMYDEMGKPMDGETCSNYEEAGEDEMIEGERLVNGEITISDCIAYLTEQQEFHDPLSASGRRIQKSISYLKNRNFVQQPRWNADIEQRIIKKMREEYEQANNLIDFASHADKPCKGGLISVESSVTDFMAWLKMQLNIKEV